MEPVVLVKHHKPLRQRRVRRPMGPVQFVAWACVALALAHHLTTLH